MALDFTDMYSLDTGSGMIIPTTENMSQIVATKMQEIFGSELDVSTPETPVGRLIASWAAWVRSAAGVTAQNANQFNVNFATGIYLDSLAQAYSLTRHPGTKTNIDITVTVSSQRMTIPAGSLIMDTRGNLYSIDSDIVFGEFDSTTSSANGTATALEYGPISPEAGEVKIIQTAVLGWVSVTNEATMKNRVGGFVETDEAFRKRLKESRPVGIGFKSSLISKIERIENVKSVCLLENNGLMDKYENGVVVPGHSLYLCVDAPDDTNTLNQVAEAMAHAKPVGTGMATGIVGNAQLVQISVPAGVEGATNTLVSFYRSVYVYMKAEVFIDARFYSGSNVIEDVKNALAAYVESVDIGDTVFGTLASSAIMSAIPSLLVLSISFTSDQTSLIQTRVLDVTTYAYEKSRILASDITVNII